MVPPFPQPSPTPERPSEEDAFRYGWRHVRRDLPDGTVEFDRVPLTLEDVLHPQEEDFIIVSTEHEMMCAHLTGVFRSRPIGPPITRVTSDLRIDWEVEGLRPHGPDVVVFVGMREPPHLADGTLHVQDAGGRCLLVVEVVSPSTRVNDVEHKVLHYHQAGVPLYVIIDQEVEEGPRSIVAYRWTADGYQREPLDDQGRLLLKALGVFLSLRDNRVVCHDASTGKELAEHARALLDLDAADRTIQEQYQEIEEGILARHEMERNAKQLREEAERQLREVAMARETAERKAREAMQAREEAERKVREVTQAREEAEHRAKEAREESEKKARVAEERIRHLEALLLARNGSPDDKHED